MTKQTIFAVALGGLFLLAVSAQAASVARAAFADWPGWRGPTRDGIAAPGQNPPTQWSESENIL